MATEQRGYIFHSGNNWYVRYRDNIMGPDGSVVRKQVCRKIEGVDYPAYKTKSSVRPFVTDLLAPINSGMVNAQSTTPITAFVDKIYLPEFVEKQLRPATRKQYKDVWKNHLKARVGSLTLRGFRTMHGEQILQRIAVDAHLGRSSLRHCKAFLSGVFKQAKRLGVLDGLNPMQDTSLPRTEESAETYAYSFPEITPCFPYSWNLSAPWFCWPRLRGCGNRKSAACAGRISTERNSQSTAHAGINSKTHLKRAGARRPFRL